MSEGQYAQTPYTIGTPYTVGQRIVSTTGEAIAQVYGRNNEPKANAEFIVKACNNHEKLVKACKEGLLHFQLAGSGQKTINSNAEMCEIMGEALRETKHWFEIHVNLGNGEGTKTIDSARTLKDAKQRAKEIRESGDNRPMFIDRWIGDDETGYNDPDETFEAIEIP